MKNRIRERGAAHICQTEKGSLEKEGFLLYDKKRFLWAAGLFRAESGRFAKKGRKRRHMTCQEAERLVTPYIRDELSGDELEAFLNHIDECPNCREELEIYFMVDVGLKQLDNGSGTYDIAGDLENRGFLYEGQSYVDVPRFQVCGQYAECHGHGGNGASAVSDLVLLIRDRKA